MILRRKLLTLYLNNYFFSALVNILSHFFLVRKKIHGRSNYIIAPKAILNKVSILIQGDNNTIEIREGAYVGNTKIRMVGSGHKLIIGEKCKIKSGVLWFEDHNCLIQIGRETTIEGAGILVTEPNSAINLGNDCMLAYGIDIRNGDSHSIIDLETMQRINHARNISIGDHVWLGAHVQILKGVNIGSNSVIGTRSIVTKDIPGNAVAVGIPATVTKQNVTWDRKRI